MTSEAPVALKPCPNPWCEKSASKVLRRGDCYANGYLVACGSCKIEGPYITAVAQTLVVVKTAEQAEAEAITAWNTRSPSHSDLVEALRLALSIAESWIHDQLDGTSMVDAALADLQPARAILTKAEAPHG